jgi:hypothetical protein
MVRKGRIGKGLERKNNKEEGERVKRVGKSTMKRV